MTTVAQEILRDRLRTTEFAEQAKAAHHMTERAMQVYRTRGERAAMRCVLDDAAALCDALVRDIENQNRTIRGRVSAKGSELAKSIRIAAEAMWLMRELITMPEEVHAATQ